MALQPLKQLPQPNKEELDEVMNLITAWAGYDEQIRKLTLAMKERNTQKNALTPKIVAFMQKFELDAIDTKSLGNITCKNYTKKPSVSVKVVRNHLQELQVQGQTAVNPGQILALFQPSTQQPPVVNQRLRRIVPSGGRFLNL